MEEGIPVSDETIASDTKSGAGISMSFEGSGKADGPNWNQALGRCGDTRSQPRLLKETAEFSLARYQAWHHLSQKGKRADRGGQTPRNQQLIGFCRGCSTWNLSQNQRPQKSPAPSRASSCSTWNLLVRDAAASPHDVISRCWLPAPVPRSWNHAAGSQRAHRAVPTGHRAGSSR